MQSLKWRLSFSSNSNHSKQVKQLRILWNNFAALHSKDNLPENEINLKIRIFLQFIEELSSGSNQRDKFSFVDELSDELVDIYMSILQISKLVIVRKDYDNSIITDEFVGIYSDDSVLKLLSVAELLVSWKGTKSCLSDKMTNQHEHIK